MAEVSFYILSSALLQERYLFACKLIEKAYRNGQFCYILTDSDEQSQLLDDLLWTFRAGSFIPHEIYTGQAPSTDKVILIGSIKAPEHSQGLLFNLSSKSFLVSADGCAPILVTQNVSLLLPSLPQWQLLRFEYILLPEQQSIDRVFGLHRRLLLSLSVQHFFS